MSGKRIQLKLVDGDYTLYFNVLESTKFKDIIFGFSCKKQLQNFKCISYRDRILRDNLTPSYYKMENGAEIKVCRI